MDSKMVLDAKEMIQQIQVYLQGGGFIRWLASDVH